MGIILLQEKIYGLLLDLLSHSVPILGLCGDCPSFGYSVRNIDIVVWGDFILRYGYRTCCVVRDLSVCIMFLILYGRTGGDYEELICMCLDE